MIPADAKRDHGRAQRVIDWIEKWLTITIGEKVGQPYILAPFQRRFIQDTYEPVHPDHPSRRMVKKAVLSTPKKQGKSQLTAALALVHLIGPESEPNGSVLIGANTREQATTVYDEIIKFLEGSPRLKTGLVIRGGTTGAKVIYVRAPSKRANGSVLKVLSADKKGAHGKNPSLFIADELGEAKDGEFFWAIEGSLGAGRTNQLVLVISTQAGSDDHVMTSQIKAGLDPDNHSTFAHVYEAKADCSLMDEAEWQSANPAMVCDWFDNDDLRRTALEAVQSPQREAWFRRYKLNQIVSLHSVLFTADVWKGVLNPSARLIDGEEIYLGLDLSQKTDLTALVAVSADGVRCESWFWKPSEFVKQHSLTDAEPYDIHIRKGWMFTSSGKIILSSDVAAFIHDLTERYTVNALAYDPRGMAYVMADFERHGLRAQEGPGDGLRVEKMKQGFDLEGAITALETSVYTGEFSFTGNPLLTKSMMNAAIRKGDRGGRMLVKSSATGRIDGAMALVMAMGIRALDRPANDPKQWDAWSDPNFAL